MSLLHLHCRIAKYLENVLVTELVTPSWIVQICYIVFKFTAGHNIIFSPFLCCKFLYTWIRNQVRCGQATTVLCEQMCNKVLNCFAHRCTRICHTGITVILKKLINPKQLINSLLKNRSVSSIVQQEHRCFLYNFIIFPSIQMYDCK